MRQSPTQAGSEQLEVQRQQQHRDNQKLLKARLRFVDQLKRGDLVFQEELPIGHLEQNMLVRVAAILISSPCDGPFSQPRLHRIGSILKILGERSNQPTPAKWFLQFDIFKQMEMVHDSRNLSVVHRSLAISIMGIYPVVPDLGSPLPLFVPQQHGKSSRLGNRNWQLSRKLLEQKFKTKEVQELRESDAAVFLCYEILLNRVNSEFGSHSWVSSLWCTLYRFYFQSCMEAMVDASRKDVLNADRSMDERDSLYSNRPAPLKVEWDLLLSTNNVSQFDRLSIKLIQAIVEERPAQMEDFQQELIRFSRNPQYEDGMLKVMGILYKHTQNADVKSRLLQLAEAADQVEAFLPLLPTDDDIVRYFEARKVVEPQRIRNFPDELRNRLAESSWRINPLAIMELEGSLRTDIMQLHVLETLPGLPLDQMKKALKYIQQTSHEAAYRTLVGTNNYSHFKELIKEWDAFYRTLLPQTNDMEVGRKIFKLLQSKQQSLQNGRVKIAPPRMHERWLLLMLKRVFAMVEYNSFAPEFIQLRYLLVQFSKQAFCATAAYLHEVLPEKNIINDVYPELSKILCRDPLLIQELSHT